MRNYPMKPWMELQIRIADRDHKCSLCGSPIHKGEEYLDGSMLRRGRVHSDCAARKDGVNLEERRKEVERRAQADRLMFSDEEKDSRKVDLLERRVTVLENRVQYLMSKLYTPDLAVPV